MPRGLLAASFDQTSHAVATGTDDVDAMRRDAESGRRGGLGQRPFHASLEVSGKQDVLHVATVAVARKLAILCWHLLTREEDYAFARPSLVRQKVRLLELAAGDARRIGYRNPVRVVATPAQHRLEREVGAQAEKAYRGFVKDFLATGKKGAGAITGARISVPRKGQAPRQEQAPDPAL